MGIETFRQNLAQYTTISFDTMVVIYFLERNAFYFPLVSELFQRAEQEQNSFSASIMIYLEVMTGVYKRGHSNEIEKTKQFFAYYGTIAYQPINCDVADTAAHLRVAYGLKTPDAIILATALVYKANALITNDASMKKISVLPIVCLGDYI